MSFLLKYFFTKMAKDTSPNPKPETYKMRKVLWITIFLIVGVSMIAIGLWVHFNVNKLFDFSCPRSGAPSFLIMTTGILIILMAIYVCFWSTEKGSPFVMYTCSFCLLLVVIIQVSAAVMMIVFRKDWQVEFDQGMKEAVMKYRKGKPNFDAKLDDFQSSMECCGITSYSEWIDLNPPVPKSCCVQNDCDTSDSTALFNEGCKNVVNQFLKRQVAAVSATIIIMALLPLFGISLFCTLARSSKKSDYQSVK